MSQPVRPHTTSRNTLGVIINSTEAAIHVVEGLLIELAAEGFIFRLTAAPHAEEGFIKSVTGVRLADGSWETESVELITEALSRRADLQSFTLRTTSPDTTSQSGKLIQGKLIGLTRLDLSAGVAVVESLGLMGTRENLIPFCGTAIHRAQAIVAELEDLAEGQQAA